MEEVVISESVVVVSPTIFVVSQPQVVHRRADAWGRLWCWGATHLGRHTRVGYLGCSHDNLDEAEACEERRFRRGDGARHARLA